MSGDAPAAAGTPLSFGYGLALAPLIWAFAAIMAVELLVVHLLVSIWSRTGAIILSAFSLAMLAWTVALACSLPRRPVLVGKGEVAMRLGILRDIRIPAKRIAGVRTSWPSGAHKAPGVLNLALINAPNLILDIDPPLTGLGPRRRTVRAVAHRLDDPAGFAAAIAHMEPAHG